MKETQNVSEDCEKETLEINDADKITSSKKIKKEGKKVLEKELKIELAQTQDKYMRLAAEFDNFRRRSAKERLDLIGTAGEDVIKGFLPILDDCERAVHVLKDLDTDDAAKEGIELIYNKLLAFLKTRGVALIDAMGKDLDTDFHEAVAQFPVEDIDKKNKIIDVVQQGYLLHEKVIRFAKVVVGI